MTEPTPELQELVHTHNDQQRAEFREFEAWVSLDGMSGRERAIAWPAWQERGRRCAEQLAVLKDQLVDADEWARVHRAEKVELLREQEKQAEAVEIVALIEELCDSLDCWVEIVYTAGAEHAIITHGDWVRRAFSSEKLSEGLWTTISADSLLECLRKAVEAKRATTTNG